MITWTRSLWIIAFMVVVWWFAFEKAGKPGWGAVVPFYNLSLFCEIAGKPWWWLFFLLIPGVNVVFYILICIGFAKAFGRSGGFAVGLIFLPVIFFAIIGFSSEIRYVGPVSQE